ncbi:tetratricopeptide repeat protein [Flavobacterium sp. AC]|uniref:histidine kinase n=1 Tax=Flavobacterium azizsancarii TaxID=2961580 RepID=A0ABT4WIE0_9FLAO|nr:tetratricopeptide repeat-containing sensor histidine kinase [Flavobacterium azizsancarii]MDA6072360.1 tetratricopeptide repeat protein [Flavobacterium azizsancarii]
MGKLTYLLKNRGFLKYPVAILLLGAIFFLLNYYKKETHSISSKKDNSVEIKKLTDMADLFYDSNKIDSAYFYFNKVKNICDPHTNTIDYVYALSCLSELQMSKGNYIASEANATAALPCLKHIKNPRYSWIVYNQLGINYTNSYNYNNAIVYFKKAISLKSSAWRKYIALNNLAAVYMNQEKYREAKKILLILSTQKRVSKHEEIDYDNYSYVIDNLGFCYYKLGDSKTASKLLYEALNIRLRHKTPESLILSFKHFAVFFEKTNPKLAKHYAKKTYREAIKTKNVSDLTNALSLAIKNSEGNELKKYSLNYIKIIDSITAARQQARNQFSNIKYTSQKDKTENLQLKKQKVENELQLERQKNRNIVSYIIILFTSILSLFLYFHLITKGKKEKNHAILESEMRISKKLHDELANDVYTTLNFAKSTDLKLGENKEHLLNNLENIYSRTRNISKENSPIITDHNYNIALKEMISGYKTSDVNIILNGFDLIFWSEIEKNKKIILYRIIQELFSNMKKHSKATLVSISFKMINKNLTVIYNDNGLGTQNEVLNLKNGLQNVESRIKTINGNIIFDNNSEKGFRLSFSFPL